VKRWSQFWPGARLLNARSDGEQIELMPTENRGPRGGFTEVPDAARSVGAGALDGLGAAVRDLFGGQVGVQVRD
jgi:hypothetical protein